MMKSVTIKKFSEETGYSEQAVRSKIKRGDWLEGELWTRAPDGRILMDMEAYERWVKRENPTPVTRPRRLAIR